MTPNITLEGVSGIPTRCRALSRRALCLLAYSVAFSFLNVSAAAGAVTIAPLRSISSGADLQRAVAALKQPETRQQAFSALMQFCGGSASGLQTADARMDALRGQAYHAAFTDPDIEAVVDSDIVRLNQPQARMQAVRDLVKFAWPQLFQVGSVYVMSGDAALDDLQRKTAAALSQHADAQTVSAAIGSADRDTRFWGVWSFHCIGSLTDWTPLLAELEQVATTDTDSSIRLVAVQRLQWYPQAQSVLAGRIGLDKSPDVVMELLGPSIGPDPDHTRFYGRLLALLQDPDTAVRQDALGFIGSNSNNAPMWQFTFDEPIFNRVIALTYSVSAQERADATSALTDIRSMDRDRSRAAFIRLSGDADSDVRWRVPGGLAGQFDQSDVRGVLDTLLKDRSPVVRMFTIMADGPAKHVQELEDLARCPDKEIAGWASYRLQQIGRGQVR